MNKIKDIAIFVAKVLAVVLVSESVGVTEKARQLLGKVKGAK